MNACMNVKDPNWSRVINKVGIYDANKYFVEHGEDGWKVLEDAMKVPVHQKMQALKSYSQGTKKIEFTDDDGRIVHEYEYLGVRLQSVSRVLDGDRDLKYQDDTNKIETETGNRITDTGTDIHSVFEMFINSDSEDLIKKFIQDKNLPPHVFERVKSTINKLSENGKHKLVAEIVLPNAKKGYAGQVDIVRFRDDGRVDIIDIKTSHQTLRNRNNNNIWNPELDFGGYKVRRYSTQVALYAKLVEDAIGHPVSDHIIVPLEVLYSYERTPEGSYTSKGIYAVNTVELNYSKNTEPVNEGRVWGWYEQAMKKVAKFQGEEVNLVRPELKAPDTSTEAISELIGKIPSREINYRNLANKRFLNDTRIDERTGKRYYFVNNTRRFFKSDTQEGQIEEFIDRVLMEKERAKNNIAVSINNYLNSLDDSFLQQKGIVQNNLKAILKKYEGRQNLKAYELSEIKGFEDKQNWIVIQDGNRFDLIYVTNEDLNKPLKVKNNNTLFGEFMSSYEAERILQSKLKNTISDAKKLEYAMIVAQIRDSIPDASFDLGHIISVNDGNKHFPEYINIHENLNILKNMANHPELKRLVPKNIIHLFNHNFDSSSFQHDYVKIIKDNFDLFQELQASSRIYLENYGDKEFLTDELIEVLQNEIAHRKINLATGDDDTISFMLAQSIMVLKKVNTDINPISIREKIQVMPENIRNSIINDLAIENDNALSAFKARYWDNYKKKIIPIFNKLYKESTLTSKVTNMFMSETSSFFEPLMERGTFEDINTGKKLELSTFRLKKKNTPAYNQLNKTQQDAIDAFNAVMQEYSELNGMKWEEGKLPLIKSSLVNSIFSDLKRGTMSLDRYRTLFIESLSEEFWFGQDYRKAEGEESVRSRFKAQSQMDFADTSQELLGINLEDNKVDMNQYAQYETNIEIMLDMFAMDMSRTKEMNPLNNAFITAKTLTAFQKESLFGTSLGTNLETINIWQNAMVHNRDHINDKFDARAMKTIKGINAVASIMTIGFKPTTGFFTYIAQELNSLTTVISNEMLDKAKGVYGTKEWVFAEGYLLDPRNWEKVDLMLQEFRIFDMDYTSLSASQRRVTNKSILQTKNAYAFLRYGDWRTRAAIMVAQMMQDGVLDAINVESDPSNPDIRILKYDESKDGRFNGRTLPLDRGKLLKQALSVDLKKRNLVDKDGKLLLPYDSNQTRSLKSLADSIVGGLDRDKRAMYNFMWQGKLFGTFKSWLPARIDRLYGETVQENQHKFRGRYHFEVDPDTKEVSAVWKGDFHEGIAQSVLVTVFNAKKMVENMFRGKDINANVIPLNDVQKANLMKLTADSVFIGMASIIGYYMTRVDWEDKEYGDDLEMIARRSIQDLVATYDVIGNIRDIMATPVAVSYIMKVLNTSWNLMTGERSAKYQLDNVLNITPIKKDLELFSKYLL